MILLEKVWEDEWMKITKDEYVEKIRRSLDNMTEEVAADLFVLGSMQDFIDGNDIFDAIHAYLGSIEIPVSDDERSESIDAIRRLIDDYEKEK